MKKCCCENKDTVPPKIDFKNLEGLICYCFKHSKNDLFEAVKNSNEDQIVNDIKTKMINPGCFCEAANVCTSY
jgi:hypothetical protein